MRRPGNALGLLFPFLTSTPLPHRLPRLKGRQLHCALIGIACKTGKICRNRWVKFGVLGSIIHAGADGSGWQAGSGTTGAGDTDPQPLPSSSQVSSKLIIDSLRMS